MQSYRKAPTAVRPNKKPGARPPGLTEEQKQEIRRAHTLHALTFRLWRPPIVLCSAFWQ